LVEIGPPPQGASTVVVDADQPAQVTVSHAICLTPCTVHLPRGTHPLQFRSADGSDWEGDGVVNVETRPVAFRYALGHYHRHMGARVAGWVLFGVGMGLMGSAAATAFLAASDGGSSASDRAILTGEVYGGLAMAIAGAAMLAVFRQELQPGTGVQWELPASPLERAKPAVSHP
jgi:hypothetical protein